MFSIFNPDALRRARIRNLESWAGRIKRDVMRTGPTSSVLTEAARLGRMCVDFHNSDYGAGLDSFGVMPTEAEMPPTTQLELAMWLDSHVRRLMEKRGITPEIDPRDV